MELLSSQMFLLLAGPLSQFGQELRCICVPSSLQEVADVTTMRKWVAAKRIWGLGKGSSKHD